MIIYLNSFFIFLEKRIYVGLFLFLLKKIVLDFP